MRLRLAILLCGLMLLPGCIVIQVTARNPIPEMTTIAVAPFFNLTQEPNSVVDGRRFALAYYSELQKTPGFEVIPIGITEAAILEHRLELQNPTDALRLCKILNADAIVIGAVTDYDAYYPPRIGLQVDWYSPYEWTLPTTSAGLLDGSTRIRGLKRMQRHSERCAPVEYRGQSPDANIADPRAFYPPSYKSDLLEPPPYVAEEPQGYSNVPSPRVDRVPLPSDLPSTDSPFSGMNGGNSVPGITISENELLSDEPDDDGVMVPDPSFTLEPGLYPELGTVPLQEKSAGNARTPPTEQALPPIEDYEPAPAAMSAPTVPTTSTPGSETAPQPPSYDVEFDPTQPLMSYTRMFDGADAELVNKLRDYLELRGDRRQGSWEEYLHRSEDFIRFVSHVMIVEMLSVHGGANRTQIVFKFRKYR